MLPDFNCPTMFPCLLIEDDGKFIKTNAAIMFEDIVALQEIALEGWHGPITKIIAKDYEMFARVPFDNIVQNWAVYKNWKRKQQGVYVKFNAN